MMHKFFHRKLPKHSTLLSGQLPCDDYGFRSDNLQIWYNDTEKEWFDTAPHYHKDSDEIFIVLEGEIVVEVEEGKKTIGAGEYCCFPAGMVHQVVKVNPPVVSFMIRAPSVSDKIYIQEEA